MEGLVIEYLGVRHVVELEAEIVRDRKVIKVLICEGSAVVPKRAAKILSRDEYPELYI
jgi:hypothetical protein